MNASYSISNGVMNIFLDGESYVVGKEHHKYDEIWDTLKSENYEAIEGLVDSGKAISVWGNNVIVVQYGEVYYRGTPVSDEALVSRMVEMINQDEDCLPMAKFIENLMQNPDPKVIPQVYRFLGANLLPITKDGCFLAYKKVTGDFKDIHTGSIDNSVGLTVKEDRSLVDPDPNQCCSKGLHVCSFDYLKSFSGETLILCKVNPRDVVAVPHSYHNTKLRCCEYYVYSDITGETDPRSVFDDKIVWEAKPQDKVFDDTIDEEEDEDEEDFYDWDYEDDEEDYEEEDEDEDEDEEEDEIVPQTLRTGQVVYRDAKGHFVSKK